MTLGRPGDLLADRYRLDRFVSGAGAVERWRAFDERLARPVTVRLEPVTDPAEQDEPTAAAQAALASVARLNHPGVAAVYDVGTADELHGSAVGYAISEWTDGRTLGQIMATGPQSWPRTADWGKQISGALAALHEIGVAHGALSPESVAIHDDRQVKILDVGLEAAEARAGAKTSDQCAQDLPAGAPDDVYALGFLLWEATVGAAPEYVIPGEDTGATERESAEAADDSTADATADTQDIEPQETAEGVDGAATVAAPTASKPGIDQQPLLDTGAPTELVALLTQMLAADAALRPTTAEAERRFAPFASAERVGDALPGIAAASAETQVLGPPVAGAGAAAVAAEAAKAERDRRRGALLGLVLLVAAVLAGLGFLLVDLNSHSGRPVEVNTVIPSSSPGMVTLPNGSLSPAPTLTTTGGGQQTTFAPTAPASSATPSQAPTSRSAAPSSSATASASPSSTGAGPSSSPAGPGGGTASASATSAPVLSHATTLN